MGYKQMTKSGLLICLVLVVLVGNYGCAPSNISRRDDSSDAIDGKFPEFLVGTWRPQIEDDSRWILTFARDGSISKMTHSAGMEFEVDEGGLVEKWHGEIEAIYGLGPCEVEYNKETGQLNVTVVITDFLVYSATSSLEGDFHDTLRGSVSEDGKTWKAVWISKCNIIGGGVSQLGPKELTFTKISGD